MSILNLVLSLGRFRRNLSRYFATAQAPTDFPTTGPRLIVTLAADYPNLGDVALTSSVINFCREHLPSHQVFILPAQQTLRLLKGAARHTAQDDVVVIVGGGNLGDRYRRLEESRCAIIESFPNQRIVSFPQSCEFRNSLTKDYSRKVYSAHPNLTLFARDQISLQRMRKIFPSTRVALAPDTALRLMPAATAETRVPLICLRTDGESNLSPQLRNELIQALLFTWPQAKCIDTVALTEVEGYPRELQHKFLHFANASVVITDRLHGLIFAKIHQKPCVVIEGVNDKIRAFINTWMPQMKDVCLVESPSFESISQAVEQVTSAPTSPAIDSALFQSLVSALKGEPSDILK